jgi:hypothetical protein
MKSKRGSAGRAAVSFVGVRVRVDVDRVVAAAVAVHPVVRAFLLARRANKTTKFVINYAVNSQYPIEFRRSD